MAAFFLECEMIVFHGTTDLRANEILKERKFACRPIPRMWLGYGAYFFQNGPILADAWASSLSEILNRRSSEPEHKPAVLRVEIQSKNLLDLTDAGYWEEIKEHYHQIPRHKIIDLEQKQNGIDILGKERSSWTNEQLQRDEDHPLDHVVLDTYIELVNIALKSSRKHEIDAVKAAIPEGFPIYANSWFLDQSNVMICIKDQSIIQSVRII